MLTVKAENKLCFVQFIHPRGEHTPKKAGTKNFPWNTKREHKRKFLRSKGRYCEDINEGTRKGEILFWGEWEPESEVEHIEKPVPDGPAFIHEPFYVKPDEYEGHQNTDPFVFGKPFHYTLCQQHIKGKPSTLRYLEKGSVILFGSCLHRKFVLDTVFVVSDYIDIKRSTYSKILKEKKTWKTYTNVTILPIFKGKQEKKLDCGKPDGNGFRLYSGTTFDEREKTKGMFSFFPCSHARFCKNGFKRPAIRIKDLITDNLSQGKKLNCSTPEEKFKDYWDEVVHQIKRQKMMLGTFAELPKRRSRSA
jgi:hypothetical protein